MIDLNIDAGEIRAFQQQYGADDALMKAALRSTVAKMARWVRGLAQKDLPKELKMKASVIRRRLRTLKARTTRTGAEAAVFFGLDPVALKWLNPRQTRKGVSTKPVKAAGAFIAKTPKGSQQVFRRTSKSRLPLEVVKAPVEPSATPYVQGKLFSDEEFADKFFEILEREIKWRT